MKIETSAVTKLCITGVEGLDPITVFLEDFGPNRGKITVSCWGKSWTAYWGGMWDGMTVGQFFRELNAQYIIGYFDSHLPSRRFSGNALVDKARRLILKERRTFCYGRNEARELYDDAEDLREASSIEVLHYAHSELICKLFGDEWWCLASSNDATEPNPDYAYLERIIAAVQQALAEPIAASDA
jgi:hypothetical protein